MKRRNTIIHNTSNNTSNSAREGVRAINAMRGAGYDGCSDSIVILLRMEYHGIWYTYIDNNYYGRECKK